MRMRIVVAAAGLAVLCAPAGAAPQPVKGEHKKTLYSATERQPYEKRYLDVRERYVDEFGLREAGRDLVRDGLRERGGEVRPATRAEVARSTERMVAALNPPEPAPEAVPVETETAAVGSPGSMAATVQCESGGDYSAVNPAGYYGAYQFDQQTWDAYAPEGYAGTNPAQAPSAVQDAAAANVDHDAWPNC